MKDKKIANKLKKYSQTHIAYAGYKVVACVCIGKSLIFGKNSKKTHPLQGKYGKNKECIHIHAEIDVLRKIYKRKKIPNTLYILRGTNRQFLVSLPCDHCEKALRTYGIAFFKDCTLFL